jgi:hypothetical protein
LEGTELAGSNVSEACSIPNGALARKGLASYQPVPH